MSVALPDARPHTLHDQSKHNAAREQSRRDSVLSLMGEDDFSSSPVDLDLNGHTAYNYACEFGRAHIVELPVPGQICATIATHEPLHAIDAIGWRNHKQTL